MKYKYKNGGVIKFQNAGSLPKWMQKLNAWANKNVSESDESVGERILNSTIEQANKASTQEERGQIYKDSAKNNLAVTGQSLMMLPMLGEFATYGLLGGGLRLGTGIAGSKAGEYVLGKGGDWADKKLNTKFLGTTGRIIGGLGGWWGGSSATMPLFRNLAGKGITLHIPQETFANLRSQYFTNAGNKALINLNSKSNPTLISTINHLYKEYPELSSIGPKEAYRQYYETIFPASKIQTPYVHGTKSDLSGGLETSVKIPNAAAPETIGRNDFYLNLQPEASLQYADGIGVPKGFTWNKHRFWPLKEILGKPYKSDVWMSKPIKLREQVPNRAGQFSRVKNADGTYSGHGKLLEEYKAELGMQDLSNEEFLQRLGVQDEESFNQWVAKNKQMFSDIYDSGDYHGLYHVKIDASKPLTINGGNTYYSERGIWNRMNKGGNDVLLHNNAANEFGSDVAVVRDVTPQKVRILGSKPDQQGFADFMGGKQRFFAEIPTSPQEAATTYHFDPRVNVLGQPISIAEKLGIPKVDRGLFDWNKIELLRPRFNKWAEYYGYDQIPESVGLENAVDMMKNTFKRHNTFFRGIHNPDTPEDIAHIESLFGKDYNLDDVYKYVATHGRPGDNAVFVSPLSNAGIYGSTGKTAIVRRRFKLGRNPETWLQDADFDIIFGGSPEAIKVAQEKNTFTFPWNQRGNGIVENELLAPDGTINFIDFVPSNASTSYFDSNGSLNKYLGYKSFHDVYGFGDYNMFTDVPIEKPKFKQGGIIKGQGFK